MYDNIIYGNGNSPVCVDSAFNDLCVRLEGDTAEVYNVTMQGMSGYMGMPSLAHSVPAVLRRVKLHEFTRKSLAEAMKKDGVKLLDFKSLPDLDRYITRNAIVDYLDITIKLTDDDAYSKIIAIMEAVLPNARSKGYEVSHGIYDRESRKKLISIHQTKDSNVIRIKAPGAGATILSEIIYKMFWKPYSLSEVNSYLPHLPKMHALELLDIDAVKEKTGIDIVQPPKHFYLEAQLAAARLNRIDVAFDVSRSSTSFEEIVNTAVIANEEVSKRGRKRKVLILGNEEYGRTVYFGSIRSERQTVIYEKNKLHRNTELPSHKRYESVHTRSEERFRPKRNKNNLPELAYFMSVLEIVRQSNLMTAAINEAKRPSTRPAQPMCQTALSLLAA